LQRFRRGELDLVENVDPELFGQIAAESPAAAHDAGPSLDSEVLWWNQSSSAPLAESKKQWFQSANFRRAVSEAIHRDDLCRVVFHNRAQPAAGPVSAANRFWYNTALRPHPFDPASALRRLERDGFRRMNGVLRDASGHPVEFSVITNAGNTARERMAAMIQQDLEENLGIHLNIVTLDFPSLIERISRTGRYEACLLGLINAGLDPNTQMNIWLSSAGNHQWNPSQKSPATPWEAEIDRLMLAQSATTGKASRKTSFDRVQQIAWEQEPFVYLVNRNALSVVSPALRNVAVTPLRPQTYWNADRLRF
jgi:peptide/nickel transport system substrate-binding protein